MFDARDVFAVSPFINLNIIVLWVALFKELTMLKVLNFSVPVERMDDNPHQIYA